MLADGRRLVLQLGAKESALWAKKITNPPSRLDKLGIKAGTRVAVLRLDDADFELELKQGSAQQVDLSDAEVVLAAIEDEAALNKLDDIARNMPQSAHLWLLRPRGAGQGVSEAAIMQHGRSLGLKLSKTMRFSDHYTGERFSWPKS
jgi:hypothetical protein